MRNFDDGRSSHLPARIDSHLAERSFKMMRPANVSYKNFNISTPFFKNGGSRRPFGAGLIKMRTIFTVLVVVSI